MGLDLSQVYVVVLLLGMTDKMIPIFMRGHLGPIGAVLGQTYQRLKIPPSFVISIDAVIMRD